MTDSYRKRANAGPTVGEKRQEEVCPERHGHGPRNINDPNPPKWLKLRCSCGFLMGYRFDSSYDNRTFPFSCVSCHKKLHGS